MSRCMTNTQNQAAYNAQNYKNYKVTRLAPENVQTKETEAKKYTQIFGEHGVEKSSAQMI